MIMLFRKFLTFFVKFWDDPHKRSPEKVFFFTRILLLIFITSPNSDLRNALIKKQPKFPKIDGKTTKIRPKLVQKSSIDFCIVFFILILGQFFHRLGTTLGSFSDKLVVRGVSRRPSFAFRDAYWPQFPHLESTLGYSWPIATQTAPSWPLSKPSGGPRSRFETDFGPILR